MDPGIITIVQGKRLTTDNSLTISGMGRALYVQSVMALRTCIYTMGSGLKAVVMALGRR